MQQTNCACDKSRIRLHISTDIQFLVSFNGLRCILNFNKMYAKRMDSYSHVFKARSGNVPVDQYMYKFLAVTSEPLKHLTIKRVINLH